jgi:hypothetical protein
MASDLTAPDPAQRRQGDTYLVTDADREAFTRDGYVRRINEIALNLGWENDRLQPGVSFTRKGVSDALEHGGDALPDADAHGGERVARLAFEQLVGRGGHEPRPAHP